MIVEAVSVNEKSDFMQQSCIRNTLVYTIAWNMLSFVFLAFVPLLVIDDHRSVKAVKKKTVTGAYRSEISKMGWDDLCSRSQFLSVAYPYNDMTSCGETFPLESLAEKPKVQFDRLGDLTDKNLTLIMVDPDAPSKKNPSCRCWVHWIVADNNVKNKDSSLGREIVRYQPPRPPSGSGKHRYYFLLYAQNDKTVFLDDPEDRCKFNIDAFAAKLDLDGPIASSMVKAERP